MKKEETNILKKLKEVANLYSEIKPILVLSEEVSNSISVSSINEIRSSLDHILRGIINEDKIETEINKAKAHLYRATLDAYHTTIIEIIEKIGKDLRPFSSHTISSVFPEYYKEIKPKLIELQTGLRESRTQKNMFDNSLKYDKKSLVLGELIEYQNKVISIIPALSNFEKTSRRKKIKGWIINVIIGVISALIATLITIYLI